MERNSERKRDTVEERVREREKDKDKEREREYVSDHMTVQRR